MKCMGQGIKTQIIQSKIYLEGKNECAFVYDYMIEIWYNIHNV